MDRNMENKSEEEDTSLQSAFIRGNPKEDNGRFKQSNYNFFFGVGDDSEDHLLYNSFSGGFAKIPAANVEIVQDILNNPNNTENHTPIRKPIFEAAHKGGYIIGKDINEKAILKTLSLMERYSSEHFHLVIMPTMICNFKCAYCFQKEETDIMSREFQEVLVKWVETRLRVANRFTVGWFGGEPLLAIDCIDYLSSEFIRLCDKYNVEYYAGLTTNGYLMDQATIDRFGDWRLRNVQITLDGPPDIHNKLRPLRCGKGTTYDVLINNLLKLYKSRPDSFVMIRVNVGENTIDHVPRFFDNLPEIIRQKAHIYLASIYQCSDFLNTDPTDNNISDGLISRVFDKCTMRQKMAEMALMTAKYRKNYPYTEIQKQYMQFPLKPRMSYCMAQCANQYAIGPTGSIHKCTVSLQDDLKVGQLYMDGTVAFNLHNLVLWMGRDCFDETQCGNCKALPVCSGGCTSAMLMKRSDSNGCATGLKESEIARLLVSWHREGLYGCA